MLRSHTFSGVNTIQECYVVPRVMKSPLDKIKAQEESELRRLIVSGAREVELVDPTDRKRIVRTVTIEELREHLSTRLAAFDHDTGKWLDMVAAGSGGIAVRADGFVEKDFAEHAAMQLVEASI